MIRATRRQSAWKVRPGRWLGLILALGAAGAATADDDELKMSCRLLAADLRKPAETRVHGVRPGLGQGDRKTLIKKCCSTKGMPCPDNKR